MTELHPGAPRRLHPGTILLAGLTRAPSTILGLPAFFAFVSNRGLPWVLGTIAVMAVIGVALMWLRWLRFTYAVGEDAILIERGLLSRSRRSIPFDSIKDVSIVRGPLARLFGLAVVRIETGGADKDEGLLDSVSLAEAERLRATLRAELTAGAAPAGDVPQVGSETLFRMGLSRLLIAGPFNFSLVFIAAAFGALQWADEVLNLDWGDMLRWLGIAERELRSRATPMSIAAVALAAVLLGLLTGMVRTMATNFGFRLTLSEGRFRRVRGLLTRSETVIARRRIQLALIRRALISGRLGFEALSFQTLGGSDDPSGRQEVAPFARRAETAPIVAAAGLPPFDALPLRPVAPAHVLRMAIRRGVPIVVVACAAAIVFPLALAALALAPFAVGFALLERSHHRYALGARAVQVNRCVLVQREWQVPASSVQVVSVRAGPIQRLLGVASVRIDTAGAGALSGPHVTDIAADDAAALARGLLDRMLD